VTLVTVRAFHFAFTFAGDFAGRGPV
jgi:hypothetical protein